MSSLSQVKKLCVSIVLLSGREYGVYLGNLFDLRSCCGCLHESPNTLHAVKAGMRLVQAHVKHYGPLALQDANRKVRECQNRSSAVLGGRSREHTPAIRNWRIRSTKCCIRLPKTTGPPRYSSFSNHGWR